MEVGKEGQLYRHPSSPRRGVLVRKGSLFNYIRESVQRYKYPIRIIDILLGGFTRGTISKKGKIYGGSLEISLRAAALLIQGQSLQCTIVPRSLLRVFSVAVPRLLS